jgi:hypothetical protein
MPLGERGRLGLDEQLHIEAQVLAAHLRPLSVSW